MKLRTLTLALVAGTLALSAAEIAPAQTVDPKLYEGMQWRLIGPFRGGRSVACAGSQARPDEYYFGATGGGVWKTTDAGENWECVSDGFFNTASVGAIAVSASNPDVVYAGTGERDIRGNISHGDGMYKTTDGGKTWNHIGLKDCQTISRIVVHPTNPDIVYVAAFGHVYGPNRDRGIYKSTDGGRTWQHQLFENDKAGAVHIVMDPKDPETLYAATWEAWRTPYTLNSGGPGSKMWKTTNGGANWINISRNPGLPKGLLGKIGISVSPVDSKRVYAIIEAEDGGIFASDDAGATWTLTNDDRNWRQRAWYYTHVVADTKEKDTVYVLNVGMGRSTDGGKTFRGVGTPHSDNHDLWIAPDDPSRMINSNDGGANVSKDAGRTWTEQDIPTSQFYHVTTDNHFPYRVYGAQQDNSTVRIFSRVSGGGIGSSHWEGTAGGESGYIAVKPDNPDVVFGGSYGGYLEMLNHRTGQSRNVNPWPDNPMGHGAVDLVHRIQWTFPIVFSPNDPNLLYTCSQYVMKSSNGGQTWQKISPDLTRNDPSTMGPSGGPITKDNTSVEYYGTVFTVAESPRKSGVIWAGSDDGLIHVTQNGGRNWTNVTPPGMPKWGLVSIIEASPHAEGTAYAAVDNHENDDYGPYVYKTSDFGKTWTKIVTGIPATTFARAIREDPVKKGLLYLGTETGMYVSFNDGMAWQPLQMNLPLTPVHDLTVKDNDLVVATHGRSFWILDDVSPLRQLQANMAASQPKLYKPRDAYRLRWGGGFGGGRRGGGGPAEPMGQNAPSGVLINYYLPSAANEVQVQVVDRQGRVVATANNAPKAAGFNRTSAYLQYPAYRNVSGMIFWAAGSRPIEAPTGEYTVRLTVDGRTMNETFKWVGDPRSPATDADYQAQFDLSMKIVDKVNQANDAVVKIRDLKTQIDERAKGDAELERDAAALKDKLSAVEGEIYQVRNRSGQDPLNYPIKLNNRIAALLGVVQGGNFRPTDQSYEVFDSLSKLLDVELRRLDTVVNTDLKAFNNKLKAKGKQPVEVKASGQQELPTAA